MLCKSCKHFVNTYEGEGWCSHPRYAGLVLFSTGSEPCRGNGYAKEISAARPLAPAAEVTRHTPSQQFQSKYRTDPE